MRRYRPTDPHRWWRRVTLVLLAAGLIVAGAASAAAGAPLQRLPQPEMAPAGERSLACPTGPTRCMTYRAFVNWVGRDARQFWSREFRRAGLRWRAGHQITLPQPRRVRSRCKEGLLVRATDGPFYCPAGKTVFMPLRGIRSLVFPGARTFVPHAFAISYVAAHEWAHHVQWLLGLLHGRSSVAIELQADCLAGVWGYTAWTRQLVSQSDIQRTVAVTGSIGDPPGAAPASHGTGRQRTSAFLAGFTSGDPNRCTA